MATKHLRKPVLTDDVRAGTDVESWKSALQRNLSYILGRSLATATMNDWYSAGTTTHTIKTHVWCLRQKIERDPKNAEILITGGAAIGFLQTLGRSRKECSVEWGLGTHFIRAVMDDATFIPLPDGEGNLLELIKRKR